MRVVHHAYSALLPFIIIIIMKSDYIILHLALGSRRPDGAVTEN
jgi:hypothetical protein